MRRSSTITSLRRWACTLAATSSVLLTIAVVAVWLRGFWINDAIVVDELRLLDAEHRVYQQRRLEVRVGHGRVAVKVASALYAGFVPLSRGFHHWHPADTSTMDVVEADRSAWALGSRPSRFSPFSRSSAKSQSSWEVWLMFPVWSLTAAIAVSATLLTGMVWRRWRQRRLAQTEGLCAHCGYDLRATPQQCPECGTLALKRCAPDARGAQRFRERNPEMLWRS